eukprot:gene9592-1794_t
MNERSKFSAISHPLDVQALQGIEVTFLKVDEISHPGIQQAQDKIISGCQ